MPTLSSEQFNRLCHKVQIIFLTAMPIETRAVKRKLNLALAPEILGTGFGYDIGYYNGFLVAHRECGQAGARAAAAISGALQDFRPSTQTHDVLPLYVIMPGIAFGLRRSKNDTRSEVDTTQLQAYITRTQEQIVGESKVVSRQYSGFVETANAFLEQLAHREADEADKVRLPDFLTPEAHTNDPDEQMERLGDILISQEIQRYGYEKVSLGQKFTRGQTYQCAPDLAANMLANSGDWTGGKAHYGTILSGDVVVNDFIFREGLRAANDRAIGADMEGHSAASLISDYCQRPRPGQAWFLLVKAVCDWGVSKIDDAQEEAARAAADFLYHCFADPNLFDGHVMPANREQIAILLDPRNGNTGQPPAIFVPPLNTMRTHTRYYGGRNAEDNFLKRSLTDPAVRLTLLEGPRGSGKSEIFRNACYERAPAVEHPSWIRETFGFVLILDFARTIVAQHWSAELLRSYNQASGLPIDIPAPPQECVAQFVRILGDRPWEKCLLVMENAEEIFDQSSTATAEEASKVPHYQALLLLLHQVAEAKVGGLRVLVLSTPIASEQLDPLRADHPSVRRRQVGRLSEGDAIALLEKWDEAHGKQQESKTTLIHSSNRRELSELVQAADGLPRRLRTLYALAVQSRQSDMSHFLASLKARQSGEDSFLDTQFRRLGRNMQTIVLLLAAAQRPISSEEIQKALTEYREGMGLSGNVRNPEATLNQLVASYQLVAGVAAIEDGGTQSGWVLPNQIQDIIVASELRHMPPADVLHLYRAASSLFENRINAQRESFNGVSGFA